MSQRSINVYGICLASLLIGSTLGYLIGLKQGRTQGYGLGSSRVRGYAFTATFDSLTKLRSGEQTKAIERLESFCYSSAADLLEYPGDAQSKDIAKWFSQDLIKYRAEYGNLTNSRYPSEERLDRLLLMHNDSTGVR